MEPQLRLDFIRSCKKLTCLNLSHNYNRLIVFAATIRLTLQSLAIFQENFIAFAILYGLGFGICNGLTYMVAIHHGWLWFPSSAGLVSGIIIGGFGLGALVFGPIATSIVNPNGESPVDGNFSDAVNGRVKRMLWTLEFCYLIVVVISCLLIFPGPNPVNINDAVQKLYKT